MGGLSIWHWLIVFMFLAVAVIVVIVWAVSRVSQRPAQRLSPPPIPASAPTEARLAELASLKFKGLITDIEYEQRRQAIIQSV